eukprot:PLAT1502.1.p1 GENE.PLAT1502.1~~PLAT1502.1.p1  ORF type:complete len:347 (-),score=112.07 PLAT1502.1:56-1096(-)
MAEAERPIGMRDMDKVTTLARSKLATVELWRIRDGGVLVVVKKMLRSVLAESRARTARVFTERDCLRAVGGMPSLSELVGTDKDEEAIYFMLEPLRGGALHAHIAREAGFTIERTRFYIEQLLCGLEAMHGAGWAHRDVKASNVMLTASGDAVLIDFSLAAACDGGDEGRRRKSCVGTPHAMSPEQLSPGESGYDAFAADAWAIAVLAFECIAGKPPAQPASVEEARARLEGEESFEAAAAALLAAMEGTALSADSEEAKAAKHFITSALAKPLGERLDSISDMMAHAWFAGTDWELVRQQRREAPPFDVSLGIGHDWDADEEDVEEGKDAELLAAAEKNALFAGF